MYETQNGENGTQNWSQMDQYTKLHAFAEAAIEELDGGEGEEEYYDEEAAEGEEGEEEGEGQE